jgi:hypothetical protein
MFSRPSDDLSERTDIRGVPAAQGYLMTVDYLIHLVQLGASVDLGAHRGQLQVSSASTPA